MEAFATSLALGALIFILILVIVLIVFGIIIIIGNYKFFLKAKQDGWKAIVPFLNTYVLTEIAGLDWYWFILLISTYIASFLSNLIPIFGYLTWITNFAVLFARISLFSNLSKKLHKDTGWIILGVIFGSAVTAIAGYSSSTEIDESVEVSKDGILNDMNKGK